MFFIQVVQGNYCEAAGIGNQPLLNVFCVNELGSSEGAAMRSASLGDDGSVKLVVMKQGTLDQMEGSSLNHPFAATDLFSGFSLDTEISHMNNAGLYDPDAVAAATAASASAAYASTTNSTSSATKRSNTNASNHHDANGNGAGGGAGCVRGSCVSGGAGLSGTGGSSMGGAVDSAWLSSSVDGSDNNNNRNNNVSTPAELAAAAAAADPALLEDPVVHWALPSWQEGVGVKVMSRRKALGNMLRGFSSCEAPYASLSYHHAFSQVFAEITRGGASGSPTGSGGGGRNGRGGGSSVVGGDDSVGSSDSDKGSQEEERNTGAQIVVGSDLGLSEATLLRIAAIVSEVATMLDFPNNRPHLRVVLAYLRKLALERDLSFLAQAQPWNCPRKQSVYLMEDLATVGSEMTQRVQDEALQRVSTDYPSSNDPKAKAAEMGVNLGGCYYPSYSAVLFGSRLVAETDGEWAVHAAVRNGVERRSLLGRLFTGGDATAAGGGGGSSAAAGGQVEIAGDAADKVREEDSGKTIWSIDRFIFHQIAAAFHAMPSCRAGYLTPAEWRIQRLEHVLRRFGINRHNVSQQRQRLFLKRYLDMLRRSSNLSDSTLTSTTSEKNDEPPQSSSSSSPSDIMVSDPADASPRALTRRAKTADHQAADTYEFYFRELFHLCSDVQGDEVGGSSLLDIDGGSRAISEATNNNHNGYGGAGGLSREVSMSNAVTREASPVLDELIRADDIQLPISDNADAPTPTSTSTPPLSHRTSVQFGQLLPPRGGVPTDGPSSTRNTTTAHMNSLSRASHARRSVRQSNVNNNNNFGGGGGDDFGGGFGRESSGHHQDPYAPSDSQQPPAPPALTAREHLLQQRRYYSSKQVRGGQDGGVSVDGGGGSAQREIEYSHLLPKRHSYHDPCRYHSTFFVGDEHADSYTVDLDQLDCIPDQLSTTIKGVLLRGRDRADATLVIDWIESPEVPETAAAAAVCPDGFGIVLVYCGAGVESDAYDDIQDQLDKLQALDDDALDHLGKCILMRFPSSFHQVKWLTSPLVASYNVPGLIHFLSVNRRVNTSVAGNFDAEIHTTSSADNDTRLGLHMMHELMAHNVSRAHDLMTNGFSEGLWGHLGVQFFYCVTHMPTRGQLRAVYAEQEASISAAAAAARPSGRPSGSTGRSPMMDGVSVSRSTEILSDSRFAHNNNNNQAASSSGVGGLLPPKRTGGMMSGILGSNNIHKNDRSQFTKSFVLDAGVYSPGRGPNGQGSSPNTINPSSSPSAGGGGGVDGGGANTRYSSTTLGGTSFLLSENAALLPSTLQQLCYRPCYIPDCNDTPVLEFYGLFVGCMSPVEVCAAVEHLFAKLYL